MQKNFLITLFIMYLMLTSAHANYLLILTDAQGVNTTQCIKSYSFSNNLESLAQKNILIQDIYSEEETLTNKIWFNKPVYRKVIQLNNVKGNINIAHNIDYSQIWIPFFISSHADGTIEPTSYYYSNDIENFFRITPSLIRYYGRTNTITNLSIVVEYTKKSDTSHGIATKFQSYLHYVLDIQDNDNVITQNLNDVGVQIKNGCDAL